MFKAMAAIGPALGFLIGGLFLDIYVDADTIDTSTLSITTKDPRWVGAWWLGFPIASCLLLTAALKLFCFGRETPSAESIRASREDQAYYQNNMDKYLDKDSFGKDIKDIPKVTWLLLSNPTFFFTTLGGAATVFVGSGYSTFLAKYIQNQFNQSSKWGALLAGVVIVPGAAGGQILGGLICSKMNLKVRGMLHLSTISKVIGTVTVAVTFLYCQAPPMAGINTSYDNTPLESVNLLASCNTGCKCTTALREPVCGIDNVEYFSPCHAGCPSNTYTDSNSYRDCACIKANMTGVDYSVPMAKAGACSVDCWALPVFLTVFFVVACSTMLVSTPCLAASLRCIPECTRAFALGIQWVFLRFLGSIPGPIVFGYLIDNTCIVWKESCNDSSSCWVYDRQSMATTMFSLAFVPGVLCTIFFILAQLLYRPSDGGEHPVASVRMSDYSAKIGEENLALEDDIPNGVGLTV